MGRNNESADRKTSRVLEFFRRAIGKDDLDADDWNALKVSILAVYRTEALAKQIGRGALTNRSPKILDWGEQIEGALASMVWTRELAGMAAGEDSPVAPARLKALWERHRALASRLAKPQTSPSKRLSVLAELGGVELMLLGAAWHLRGGNAPHIDRAVNEALLHARAELGNEERLTEASFDKVLRNAELLAARFRSEMSGPNRRNGAKAKSTSTVRARRRR